LIGPADERQERLGKESQKDMCDSNKYFLCGKNDIL